MKSTLVGRARLLCAFFAAVAALLVVRLYFVQIVHGDEYRKDATSQYVESDADLVDRGSIYFTTKDGALVAAAVMQSGWRIAIRPSDIVNPSDTYEKLNAITPLDRERYFTSVQKIEDPYEEVAFRLDDAAASRVREMDAAGVILVQDEWRSYPAGILAAQAIGFVGFRGEKRAGVYGLEREWESALAASGSGLYVNPFAEIFANVEALLSSDPAAHGGSIITSLEPSVQGQLEKTLDEVTDAYSPKRTGGIVMDPRTGEIVAIAIRPTFDPNTYNTVVDPAIFGNPLVEGRYELGSIMKPLTVAIGLDSGGITEQTTYVDRGCIERSTKRICNFDGKARGTVPVQEVLSQSLNVGAAFVAEAAGDETFTAYMKKFGFDTETGIDLPNEVEGDLSPLGTGTGPDVNYAAAAYGQGISVTPIAMIRALSALAADGTMPHPHVTTGIRYQNGVTRALESKQPVPVISAETAHAVSNMLTKVYDTALVGGELKREHYSIAAKTGTAQIAAPGGGYYTDRYLHSFFGYLPAHEPRFIVFLFAIEPNGVEYASASLARPFDRLAGYLINYYDIPPDR